MADTIKQIDYTVRLLSPVLITSTVGDENISMSEDFLSGSSLLGMFAALYIKDKKCSDAHTDREFKKWFLSDELCFLNGYKNSSGQLRCLPTPLSIQCTKDAPESPLDLLFEKTQKTTSAVGGYSILQNEELEKINIARQYGFHHKRTDQILGRSLDSQIFNYEAIKPEQSFKTAITGKQDVLDAFEKWLASLWDSNKQILGRLGRSKQTEYGRVALDFSQSSILEVAEIHGKPPKLSPAELGLTFLSHVILANEYGQAEVNERLLEALLKKELQTDGLNLENQRLCIKKRFVKRVVIESYVSFWKARKPSVAAFQMGSCFKIAFNPPLDQNELAMAQASFSRLQAQGIGMRRNEGFGRVAFNWQTPPDEIEDVTQERQDKAKALLENKPGADGASPALFKEFFNGILKTNFEAITRESAARKSREFEKDLARFPKGSQISRLQQFALHAEDAEDFKGMLQRLQKTAREQIEKVRDNERKETLWEHLHAVDFSNCKQDFEDKLCKGEKDLAKEIKFNALEDKKYCDKLFKIYMVNLFASLEKMRKVTINKEAENE